MEIKDTLKKPCTDKARADFIVEYNHNQGLKIEEDKISIRALDYTEEEKEKQAQEKADKEKQEALDLAIDELIKEMAQADLMGNEEWKTELREQYQTLINGDEE